MKKLLIMGILVGIILMTTPQVQAQCPMCKASVESSLKNDNNKVGLGLNDGILYLLAMPYLIVGTVGFLWYKKYRKRPVDVDLKGDKIILN